MNQETSIQELKDSARKLGAIERSYPDDLLLCENVNAAVDEINTAYELEVDIRALMAECGIVRIPGNQPLKKTLERIRDQEKTPTGLLLSSAIFYKEVGKQLEKDWITDTDAARIVKEFGRNPAYRGVLALTLPLSPLGDLAEVLIKGIRAYLETLPAENTELESADFRRLGSLRGLQAVSIKGEGEQDWDDDDYSYWEEQLFQYVDSLSFKRRSLEVGTLIVGWPHIPDSMNRQLARLKDCYVLGLDEVAVVFCRSLLEAAVTHVLRRGQKSGDANAEGTLSELLSRLSQNRMISKDGRGKAEEVKSAANRILHGKEEHGSAKAVDTMEIISKTYSVVGELFDEKGRRGIPV